MYVFDTLVLFVRYLDSEAGYGEVRRQPPDQCRQRRISALLISCS